MTNNHPIPFFSNKIALFFCLLLLGLMSCSAGAWEMTGTKTIALHTRDGQTLPIGTVSFLPEGPVTHFSVHLDYGKFKDYFLSMKEFKCLEGPEEVQCHVPYPYPNPSTVTSDDLRWLEHALLFLYKLPRDFGAKLWNGLYYKLALTDQGLVGIPQAIDLNLISAPPDHPLIPPFAPADRGEIPAGSRWITSLSIQ